MTTIINLWGGPGVGKSTLAAKVFAVMKEAGESVELVTEYAKSAVWEDRLKVLEDQAYVSAKQWHRMWVLKDKVRFIVTDSPLGLGLLYSTDQYMQAVVRDLLQLERANFSVVDFMLPRCKPYVTEGRVQSEEAAVEIDRDLAEMVPWISRQWGRKLHILIDRDGDPATYILRKTLGETHPATLA